MHDEEKTVDYRTLYESTPPTRLFAIVAIPGIISMLVSSLYQTIDGAFVGQLLGANAFAAVNLAMPFVIINFAVADLIGVGSSVPIAIKLGEKDEDTASVIFTSACIMIIIAASLLGVVLYALADDFMRLMGAEDELVLMASQYLRIYAAFSPFTTIMFAVDNYLRICGKVRYSMVVNILMSVASAGFEFLFLFVFKSGIWGAALATCCGMLLCAFIAITPFTRGKTQLHFTRPKFSRELLTSILANGSPTFLNNIAGRVTSIIMNISLLRLGGNMAVSAYGVLMYTDGLIQPVLYGLCDSLQPAVGYNWGAKNFDRIKAIEKRCFGICGALSAFMTVGMLLAKAKLVGIFVKAQDVTLISMTVHALSLFAFAYPTRWISFATQSYMSAVGKAGYATVISVSSAFVFPVIFILTLSRTLGLDGLWLTFPFTSLMTAVVSAIILLRFTQKDVPSSMTSPALQPSPHAASAETYRGVGPTADESPRSSGV